MAEVTVVELAKTVGTPTERLLKQMQEAGLSHTAEEQIVSDEDKQTLLAFLKKSHGESGTAPKKITLKRKTLSTLKSTGGQGKKTVNVEVRKKRTYVKRDESVEEAPAPVEEVVAEVQEPAVEAAEGTPEVEAPVAAPLPKAEPKKADFDAEALRQAAAAKRKQKDLEDKQRREEVSRKKVEAAQRERQQAMAAAPAAAATDPETGVKHKRHLRGPDVAAEDEKPRKKTGTGKKDKLAEKSNKKRGVDLSEVDDPRLKSGRGVAPQVQKLERVHKEHLKHGFELPTDSIIYEVELPEAIVVSELAQRMSIKGGAVVKVLMNLGVMATINQTIDQDTAVLVVEELGHKAVLQSSDAVEQELAAYLGQEEGAEQPRAPVVTVMGHVDHGKTSLLDYIRKSRVASGEAGGITQHIGAYHVETDKGMISFLDTPGHAAFTAMRARGAQSTDIVILVVAADDGVMPQTEEAVQHARAAEVPLVVAVNKIDKEGADPDKVKNELAAKDVIPEDWGGDVQFIPVSAQTGEGVEALLEAVSLQAELMELTAPVDVQAQGVVIESRLDKGRGAVASVLVEKGTLNAGDIVIAGTAIGRVRAMTDENGQPVKSAGPSIPVEILGLDGTPDAGDEFAVVDNEKRAREVADFRAEKERMERAAQQTARSANPFELLAEQGKSTLNVVLKTDVRGSLEAISAALADLGNDEVEARIVSSGVGGIAETDISLALTTNAVVFGFNVRADSQARKVVEEEKVELRYYSVIYNLIDDVKAALSGMLAPEISEEIVGVAEVRDVFKSPKFGQVAGCMVVEGSMYRNKPIRVLRDNVVIFDGELESLRRFKDDANEVRNGLECGIGVKNYDVKIGDKIEAYEVKEVARSL